MNTKKLLAELLGTFTFFLIGLIAIVPFTGTSVNSARSITSAVIGARLDSLRVYLIGPILGAAVGWAVYRFVNEDADPA